MTEKLLPRHQTFEWGEMIWLVDDRQTQGAGLSLARMIVAPGATSEAHSHPNCSEAIHVLSGTVMQRLGDDVSELTEGETAFVPTGMVHQTTALGAEPAVLMVAYSSGTRVYQAAP